MVSESSGRNEWMRT